MRVLLILLAVLFLVDGGHLRYGHASQSRRQTKLQPRIVGGTAATPNRFPYHSLLTIYTNDGMQYMCSGSLVRQDMVVTAAHCTGGLDEEVRITRITAAVNFTSVFRSDKQYSHQRKVVEVINHKRWESATNRNDVSLMILESPVPDDVTPISINFDKSIPADHTAVSAMGMGLLEENGVSADTLQVVDVNIIPFDACSAHEPYDQVVWDKKMICASSPGRDTCLGDSGGPLILEGLSVEDDVLVGVVSFGFGCARPEYPGVYTRLSAYRFFLSRNICLKTAARKPDYCKEGLMSVISFDNGMRKKEKESEEAVKEEENEAAAPVAHDPLEEEQAEFTQETLLPASTPEVGSAVGTVVSDRRPEKPLTALLDHGRDNNQGFRKRPEVGRAHNRPLPSAIGTQPPEGMHIRVRRTKIEYGFLG